MLSNAKVTSAQHRSTRKWKKFIDLGCTPKGNKFCPSRECAGTIFNVKVTSTLLGSGQNLLTLGVQCGEVYFGLTKLCTSDFSVEMVFESVHCAIPEFKNIPLRK